MIFAAFPPLRTVMDVHNCDKLKTVICKEKDPQSLKCRQALAACFGFVSLALAIKNLRGKSNAVRFREMMEKARSHPDLVGEYVDQLMEFLDDGVRGCLSESTVEVIRKMYEDFPGDVGIFSPLILNHMILKPGECCYYAAEELHAYLSGECVECVGCSNNTIRAAMTPKFIDREALCEVAPSAQKAFLPVLDCTSIMVIVEGSAVLEEVDGPSSSGSKNQSSINLETLDSRTVSRGDIIYIPPGRRLRCVQ
ncbi:hypothetical protein ANCDUO_23179 [Ancylostoma duodenale]|uniref:Uncharacterized protein n=1 Tax=Ancylostoma duodenale TaxID=51022 RepID=A0A0C2FDZ1_9BILA|nr:hypothetical protein ANCDUO_23179 [Ancylostoma duodenale]